MEAFPFQTITICGPGLLGGSIAMAIRARLPQCSLRLWARRAEPLALARRLGITQETYDDLESAVRGASLVILATPIGAFEDLARRMLPALSPGTVITDIGSVKSYVHRTTGQILTGHGHLFIGSHPMAGTEFQGLKNAKDTLLNGATVALTNPHGVDRKLVRQLAAFWRALGCRTYAMDPVNHDRTVARISHTPHILAGLCARSAAAGGLPMADLQRLAATGFRDTTRVCSGAAGMWADILWENDVAIRDALSDCVQDLQTLISLLERQDKEAVRDWLEQAKEARECIRKQRG